MKRAALNIAAGVRVLAVLAALATVALAQTYATGAPNWCDSTQFDAPTRCRVP